MDSYLQFNQTYPLKIFKHEKGTITYRMIGDSDDIIVALMHGLMFDNNAYFQLFLLLKKRFSVLSIETVKPLNKAKDDVELVHELTQSLGISRHHMIGMNLGGYRSLLYQIQYHNKLKTLTLIQPLIYTTAPSEQENQVISTIKEIINTMDELRQTLHLDDSKMALLEQINAVIDTHDNIIDNDQMMYFEYLLSRYDQAAEINQIKTIKNHLNEPPLKRNQLSLLTSSTYLIYGNDDDPFFGHDMALVACDVLSKVRIEYINATRYDLILRPHILAYKIIKHIESIAI
ncbi:MAG: alpha/beta fold hydrolase [Acholeplasmataceae bacterium]